MPPVSYFDNNSSCVTFVDLSVGNLQSQENKLQITPNPAITTIKVTYPEPITTLSITNIVGVTLFTGKFNTEIAEVDVSRFPPGIYFLKVNETRVKKFVKQ